MSVSARMVFEGLQNTRDLGGMRTADGFTVKSGRLIRSGNLATATVRDREKLAAAVRTVVDFRTDRERAEHPDPEFPGTENVILPVISSLTAGVTREENSDELAMRTLMQSAERTRDYMRKTYLGFASSKAALDGYARFVRLLCEERSGAILWHCTAGKDRAGFASVIVEELLGVERADIMEDYLYTNICLAGNIERLTSSAMEQFDLRDPEAERALRAMFSADRTYLEGLYHYIDETYGGFGGYLRDGLGMTDAVRARIRELYLE